MTNQNAAGPPPPAESPSPASPATRDRERAYALVGQEIADKYKVLEVLGQGGFGAVFLVEITAGMVGQKLALKLLPPELSRSETVRNQFLNEIRVAMKMVDRYIVQVRDVGTTEDGHLYYTMDFCPGQTLAELVGTEGRVEPRRAALIVLKILRALRTAHGAGIIHRDLKPANVMVHHEGDHETVRVLDFGIATVLRGAEKGKGVSGSPHYMPPEQFLGEQLGFYSDLYAVGAILYEMVTGTRPYPGRTAKEVFLGLKRGPPPNPESLQPDLAAQPGLLAVIRRALERNPDRRYATAKEFFDDLNAAVQGADPPAAVAAAGLPTPAADAGQARRAPRARRAATVRAKSRKAQPQSSAWMLLVVILILGGAVLYVLRGSLGLVDGPRPGSGGKTGGSGAASTPDGGSTAIGTAGSDRGTSSAAPTTGGSTGAAPSGDPDRASVGSGDTGTATSEEVFDPVARLEEARQALAAKQWMEAMKAAGEVVRADKDSVEAAKIFGLAAMRLGQTSAARTYLAKARLKATTPDLEVILALAELEAGADPPRWNEVEDLLQGAVKLPGADRKTLLPRLADALEKQKKTAELRLLLAKLSAADVKASGLEALHRRLLIEEPLKRLEVAEAALLEADAAFADRELAKTRLAADKGLAAVREVQEYAPAGNTGKLLARLLTATVSATVAATEGGGTGPADLGQLQGWLQEVSTSLAKPEVATALGADSASALTLRVKYLRGRVELLVFEARGADAKANRKQLDEAELLLTHALTDARAVDRRKQDKDLISEILSWRGRTYAHRGNYVQTKLDLDPASGVRDEYAVFEQGKTYFIAAEHASSDAGRADALEMARRRLTTATKDTTAPDALRGQANLLLGRSYLQIARLEDDDRRMLRYATSAFASARGHGENSELLYEKWAEAYQRQGDLVKWAQTLRKLYAEHATAKNCAQAADAYVTATGGSKIAREILTDGIGKFEGRDRVKLEKKLAELKS